MIVSIGQKIIDIIRLKKFKTDYENLCVTLNFLYDLDCIDKDFYDKIANDFKNKKYHRYLKNKAEVEKYLKNIDATTIKPVKGVFREYQLKLADFSKQLISQMEQDGFQPCITGGSLLGAIRHKGFIPWDDDFDFDISREEYNRLPEYAKEKFRFYDAQYCYSYNEHRAIIDALLKEHPNEIIFSKKPSCTSAYIGTSLEDCLTVDFFPRDYINPKITENMYAKYRKKAYKKYKKSKNWNQFFKFFEKELNNNKIYVKDSENTAYAWGHLDFYANEQTFFLKKDDIYPLKRIKFEDTEYYAINNYDKYLSLAYSPDYMQIPLNLDIAAAYIKDYTNWLSKRGRKYYIDYDKLVNCSIDEEL